MKLFDTHCHVHEATLEAGGEDATRSLWVKAGSPNPDDVVAQAVAGGVMGMICVGTTADDSALAVRFVKNRAHCWASVGLHPHEAKGGRGELEKLAALFLPPRVLPERLLPNAPQPRAEPVFGVPRELPVAIRVFLDPRRDKWESFLSPATNSIAVPPNSNLVEPLHNSVLSGREEGTPAAAASARTDGRSLEDEAQDVSSLGKIVAIGECGLDYFYGHSPKEDQTKALRFQIELALEHDLPLIFHVRDAFDDFWPILDDYKGLRGVVHSFTDTRANLNKLLDRGLYVGINGIITFTKNDWQLSMAKAIPLERLVLETDAPFLTPEPIRGRVNVPENVGLVAEFLAELRHEELSTLAEATTQNAFTLFRLTNTKT